jgi:hypothetical protein
MCGRARSAILVLAILAGVTAAPALADVQTFTGPGVVIPDSGAAAPYPSTLLVSGVTAATNLTISLNGLTHTFPSDLGIEVVNPAGMSARLMVAAGDGDDVVDVNLSFNDAAGIALPEFDQIVSGTYMPTDYDPGTCLPGAPGSCTDTALTPLLASPNGVWQLYVYDFAAGDSGLLLSWSASFSTGGPPQPPGRAGYCSVAGNTNPYTGVAYPVGSFLDLMLDQPAKDEHFKGAQPANYYEGIGLSCDSPPAGYVDAHTKVDQTGRPPYFADPLWGGIYEYYTKPRAP